MKFLRYFGSLPLIRQVVSSVLMASFCCAGAFSSVIIPFVHFVISFPLFWDHIPNNNNSNYYYDSFQGPGAFPLCFLLVGFPVSGVLVSEVFTPF